MLLQLQKRRPSTSGNISQPVCYRCGWSGHISQNCRITNPQPNFPPNSVPQNQLNLPPVQAPVNPPFYPPLSVPVNLGPNNAPENRQQETLQALLALAASLNPSVEEADKEEKVDNFPDPAIDLPVTVMDSPVVPAKVVAAKPKRIIHENETPNRLPLPSPPNTPILDFSINVHYTLLNSPLLPLSPNNKDDDIPPVNTLASHTSGSISPLLNVHDPLPSTSSVQPSRDCQCREILVPLPNLDNLSPLVYYDPDSDSSSEDDKEDDFDSDANDEIDEENRRPKIKKGKNKPVNVKCYYDEAKNAYLKEETVKPDPRGGIVDATAIESPVSDLFDYYYKEWQTLIKSE
ncbi:19765_t:CDS:2, partial [Racocetra fulgida]